MNELQVFNHPDFGELGAIDIDGKAHFPASQCAVTLGFKDTINAIKQHCRWVVKHHLPHPQSPGKTIEMNFIPEGDLYRLIVRSNLPTAEKFERWVFDEVIPSIRKHGAYMTPDTLAQALQDPRAMAKILTSLADEQERSRALQAQVEAAAPAVLFAGSVSASEDCILIREMAKILKQNGVQTGERRFYEWLRVNGYLIKARGEDYNMPTQRSMELGLFMVKERTINLPDGTPMIKPTSMVTGKGQQYFVNKFLAAQAAEKAA